MGCDGTGSMPLSGALPLVGSQGQVILILDSHQGDVRPMELNIIDYFPGWGPLGPDSVDMAHRGCFSQRSFGLGLLPIPISGL